MGTLNQDLHDLRKLFAQRRIELAYPQSYFLAMGFSQERK